MKYYELSEMLEDVNARSAWVKGVKHYADVLLDCVDPMEEVSENLEKTLLNGAKDWKEYSWGGCAYVDNESIAKVLCTPSEFKRTKGGKLKPNANEEWLDTQARACFQACKLLEDLAVIKKWR